MSACVNKAFAYVFLVLLASLPTLVQAESWQELNTDTDNNEWFIDSDSIRDEGSVLRVWVNVELATRRWNAYLEAYETGSFQNFAIDCVRGLFAITRYVALGPSESRIGDQSRNRPDWAFDEIPDGSIVYSAAEYACTVFGRDFGPIDQENLELLASLDWIETDSDAEGNFYVANVYKKVDVGVAGVVERYAYDEPQLVEGRAVTNILWFTLLSCSDRKTLTAQVQMLNSRGVAVHEYEPHEDPEIVASGTPRERTLDTYCSGQLTALPEDQPAEAAPRVSGTGFFTDSGYIVTAQHVVQGARQIYISGLDSEQISARVILEDKANDIAILVPERLPIAVLGLPMARSPAELGSYVFTIGFPHVQLQGYSPKMTEGRVSGTRGMRDDPRHLQISVQVQSGNSGGPLVNSRGELTGMILAKLDASAVEDETGDLPQNVNYAIKGRYLQFLLSDLPRRNIIALKAQPTGSIEEVTREVKRAVVFIVVE
jgi:S1-C subfamily serine protease